jgi:hypothetical protein
LGDGRKNPAFTPRFVWSTNLFDGQARDGLEDAVDKRGEAGFTADSSPRLSE